MTIRKFLGVTALLAIGWITVLSLVTAFGDAPTPAYLVLLPSKDFIDFLPHGTGILSITDLSITVASEEKGFAKSLYSMGATLVLPAGLQGCIGLTS